MALTLNRNKMLKHDRLILSPDISLRTNPFAGLDDQDIEAVLLPKPFSKEIYEDLCSPQKLMIELCGRKGRGKTTHLRFLHNRFPGSPLIYLNKNNGKSIDLKAKGGPIFIDSIHHLSFKQRQRMYRETEKVIFTTHISRKAEALMAGVALKSYRFSGLTDINLKEIILRRIEYTNPEYTETDIILNQPFIDRLLRVYNDDYRGILNFLYYCVKQQR